MCLACRPPRYDRPYQLRRKQQLRKVANSLTEDQWQAILEAYHRRCAYCLQKVIRLQKDHVIRISVDGGHIIGNVVPACGACNRKKGTGLPPEHIPLKLLLL